MEKAIIKFNNYLNVCINAYNDSKEKLEGIIETKDIIGLPTACIVDGKKFDLQSVKKINKARDYLDHETTLIKNIVRILSTKEDEWNIHTDTFVGFSILSKYLQEADLNIKEQLTVLTTILEKNIAAKILDKKIDNATIIDPTLVNYDFKYLTKNQFIKIACDKRFNLVLNSISDDKLSEKQRNQKRELEEAISSCTVKANLEDIVESHKVIKEHFLDKKDNYTHADLEETILSLKKLEVDEELCDRFKYVLERKLNKQKQEYKKAEYVQEQKKNNYLTDKEYKNIRKELRNYFDFYHMKKIRPLTEDEILYCTNLLLKLDENKDVIRQFFMIMNRDKEEQKIINPITKYLTNCEKLKYYEDKLDIKEELKTLEYCFKEIFITNDYADWKKMIEEELNEVLLKTSNNYDYEIEKATTYDSEKILTKNNIKKRK